MHLIRRQILELELPREQGAAQLAQRAALLLQEKVLPQLDELFSRLAPAGRVLRISSLEVDLALVPEARFEEHFVTLCVKQISERVEELSLELSTGSAEAAVQQLDAAENAREVLFYFVSHGLMPWYAAHWSLAELEEKVAVWVQRPDAALVQRLRQLTAQQPQTLRRMSWQFSWPLAAALLELALDLVPGSLAQNLSIWERHTSPTAAPMGTPTRRRLLEAVASAGDIRLFREEPEVAALSHWLLRQGLVEQALVGGTPAIAGQSAAAESRQPVASTAPAEKNAPSAAPPSAEEASPASPEAKKTSPTTPKTPAPADQPRREALAEEQPKVSSDGRADTPGEPRERSRDSLPATPLETGQASEKNPQDTSTSPGASSGSLPAPDDRFWVGCAGLVLLAPYLPALLDYLGYLARSSPEAQPEAKYRVAHLLYYLATGALEPDESQLGLIKILSGLAWDEPLPKEIVLSDEEKEEGEALLQAVIRNWPILKNTSPDGLRTGFLQRPGLLSWSEGRQAWLLQVERQGMDILLDQLPWGFSVIKHPWMGQILMVEW